MIWLRNKYEQIRRFFYWGWNLRNNADYDYGFLEELLYIKLARLYKELSKPSPFFSMTPGGLRKLKCAEIIAERLFRDNYVINQYKSIEKRYGIEHHDLIWEKDSFEFRNNLTKHEKYVKHQYRLAGKRADQQEKNEKLALYSILSKYSQTWWN